MTTWATACRQASPAAWPSASFTMPAPNGSVTDENTTGTCGAMPCAEFTACADGVALTCSTAGWARSSSAASVLAFAIEPWQSCCASRMFSPT